jgi:Flp pilus assembly protein TadG
LERKSVWQDTAGSAMLEMATSSMVVLLAILGVMECSRALYVEHALASAAHDAARYAMVRGSTWSTTCTSTTMVSCNATAPQVTAYVKSILPPGIAASSITVVTAPPIKASICDTAQGANSPGCTVQVTLSYPFTFLLPLPSKAAINFQASAAVTISQ